MDNDVDKHQIANEVRQGEFEVWLDNCDKNDLVNLIGEDLIKERWLNEIENE